MLSLKTTKDFVWGQRVKRWKMGGPHREGLQQSVICVIIKKWQLRDVSCHVKNSWAEIKVKNSWAEEIKSGARLELLPSSTQIYVIL